MSLEPERTSRDYLYGRLLAVADRLESYALRLAKENRDTTAARLMQRFSDHPYSTWRTIEISLQPYKSRLRSAAPGSLSWFERQIDQICELFEPEEFAADRKLSGEFLLGFHCQRARLHESRTPDSASNTQHEEEETE